MRMCYCEFGAVWQKSKMLSMSTIYGTDSSSMFRKYHEGLLVSIEYLYPNNQINIPTYT